MEWKEAEPGDDVVEAGSEPGNVNRSTRSSSVGGIEAESTEGGERGRHAAYPKR